MNKFDAAPQDSNSIIVELYLSKPKFQTKLYYFELSAKRREMSIFLWKAKFQNFVKVLEV